MWNSLGRNQGLFSDSEMQVNAQVDRPGVLYINCVCGTITHAHTLNFGKINTLCLRICSGYKHGSNSTV